MNLTIEKNIHVVLNQVQVHLFTLFNYNTTTIKDYFCYTLNKLVVLTFVSLDETLMCQTIHGNDFDLVFSSVAV